MNHYYTYAYLRDDGTPYYIGKGCGKRAWSDGYRKGCKKPKDNQRILILKNNLSEEEAFRHETYMIFVFGRKDLKTGILRNLTSGGDGPSGWIASEETKSKMSLAAKGKQKTEEHKAKIAASRRGKPRSEETKRKIREKLTGRKASPETKLKLKQSHTGKVHSPETREKIRQANTGKRHTDETKQKIREAKLSGAKS